MLKSSNIKRSIRKYIINHFHRYVEHWMMKKHLTKSKNTTDKAIQNMKLYKTKN